MFPALPWYSMCPCCLAYLLVFEKKLFTSPGLATQCCLPTLREHINVITAADIYMSAETSMRLHLYSDLKKKNNIKLNYILQDFIVSSGTLWWSRLSLHIQLNWEFIYCICIVKSLCFVVCLTSNCKLNQKAWVCVLSHSLFSIDSSSGSHCGTSHFMYEDVLKKCIQLGFQHVIPRYSETIFNRCTWSKDTQEMTSYINTSSFLLSFLSLAPPVFVFFPPACSLHLRGVISAPSKMQLVCTGIQGWVSHTHTHSDNNKHLL